MKAIEKQARMKRRRRALRRTLLVAVGTAGILAVGAVAPNLVQLLRTTGVNARLRYLTKRALGRLKEKGEIEFVEKEGKKYVRLTERGERALELYRSTMAMQERARKRWDGRYRLVIFDIAEKRKSARSRLRLEMMGVGLLRVQNSVWLYPYDCEEFVALLKADLRLGKNVLYAVVEAIDNDGWIRAHFNLPARS